tara:strand:- start:161 stop:493 length:333 start_codon:yes stop_codon:yes gene_type:complete
MSFFESEQVQDNLRDIFSTYNNLAAMTANLSSMPPDERIKHIDKCRVLVDKQKTFYGRLCLAATEGDSDAADMKTRINAMSQAFGFKDLAACMDAMMVTLDRAESKEGFR